MEQMADYYVTLKPIRKNGIVPVGMNNIAFVNDPAVEEVGIYLSKHDEKIVADDTTQKKILEYLNSCGVQKPDNWQEVTEEEYFEAKNINLSNNPENSESYNDFQKRGGGGQWLVRYKYSGPFDGKNRSFCSSILRRGRLYTEEEIKNGLSNNEFGNYSIFDYKGSYGCRHIWKRHIYFEDYEDDEVRKVGFTPQVVARLDDREATTLNAYLSADEKMQVIAPLLIPNKRIARNDELGRYNMIFSADTINDIYEVALSRDMFSKKDLYKDTHKGATAPSYVVEAWITLSENDKAYSQYGFDINRMPVGTLFVHSQVTDKLFWEREIKLNKKYAYSIEALMNLSIVELSKQNENFIQTNNTEMEKSQVKLPDGEHLIEGKIYIVKDGVVVEIKEVTEEQVAVIEEVAKDATPETMEEVTEEKKEEPKTELSEDKPTEEEKPKEELAEIPEVVVEETKPDTSEIEKLKEVQDEIIEELSKLRSQIETTGEEVAVEMSDIRPLWRKISDSLNVNQKSK